MSPTERISCWVVRLNLSAWLVITFFMFTVALMIYLSDARHSMAWDLLPFLFTIDLFLAIGCGLFAHWQWHRLPKKWYIILQDTLFAAIGLACGLMLLHVCDDGLFGIKEFLRHHRGPVTAIASPNDPVFNWGNTGQLLVVNHPGGVAIPGTYDVTVHIVAESGLPISSTKFSLGWRVLGAEAFVKEHRGQTLLAFDDYYMFDTSHPRRQYYAFLNNEPILVRLEREGKILRQTYAAPNHTIGPVLPERTPEEWEKALTSTDFAETMRALVWWGGTHLDPDQPPPDHSHESLGQARIAKEARERAGVQRLLQKLTSSEDPWIREAAKLASEPEYWKR